MGDRLGRRHRRHHPDRLVLAEGQPGGRGMTMRIVADLSELPTSGFGSKSPVWWGTLAFIALEGTGFVLTIAMYLYLAAINPSWPLNAAVPDLLPGTVVTLLLLVSLVPNHMLGRW